VKHLILALLAATFSVSATATVPQSGWYFNPNESGRGFAIEIQGQTLFIAGFLYDAAGNPIWFVSGGPMSGDNTYSGAAYRTANGQPLGGSYRAPMSVPFGNAAITFPTTMDANITVNGFNFTVTREIFGFDPAAPYAGTWALILTRTAAGGQCAATPPITRVEGADITVDSNGNFSLMQQDHPGYLALSGTISTKGSFIMTLYGDSQVGGGTCPAGSASGTMTDLGNGSGSYSEGGDLGTFTLSRLP
jgi:hypothetical protein